MAESVTMSEGRVAAAERIMEAFVARTGVSSRGAASARRYLWTDAFAVFALLALHESTGKARYLDWALRVVGLVHRTLGRHRADGGRTGWISGLGEDEGDRHPTRGGLRIGKPLAERARGEAYDERLEWERDGQYFHYLTKWMHALNRVALATGEPRYNAWAVELAQAAWRAFVYRPSPEAPPRMYWKMSVDLSRPAVASMGAQDPLDGLVTFGVLRMTAERSGGAHGPDLRPSIADMARMCAGMSWATHDELGIGGLLTDAALLTRLVAGYEWEHPAILGVVLEDAERSLRSYAARNPLARAPETRLAFRELGLSIGLRGVRAMRRRIEEGRTRFPDPEVLLSRTDELARRVPLAERIESFWLAPASQRASTWGAHLDISSAMLATSLAPGVLLMFEGETAAPRGRELREGRRDR